MHIFDFNGRLFTLDTRLNKMSHRSWSDVRERGNVRYTSDILHITEDESELFSVHTVFRRHLTKYNVPQAEVGDVIVAALEEYCSEYKT